MPVSQQRRGLGKGLGALIPQGPAAPAPAPVTVSEEETQPVEPRVEALPDGTYLEEVELSSIIPNPRQPRKYFDDQALEELRDSISEVGLLQPIVVRKLEGEDGPRYELIMGERRMRASKEAGLTRVPAIVRSTDDDELLRDALLENLHRQELTPLEEAAAYKQLLDDFGATHGELAQRIGRSRSHITNTLRLLTLPPKVQTRVAAGVLSAGHARTLLKVEDPDLQDRLAARVVEEGISVRSLEEMVALREEPEEERVRRAPTRTANPPQVEEWASRLSDRLDTTVKVNMGKRKGRIVVEFATHEDLERIISQMG
ncbi:Probable chromosome-partitioning protein parB [Nocardiopsis dassonvillei]|uniref:ParB-like partition protein n=1 Tax=Nocardiopsis dassonvillei (strain ATCC 23218 / DSM 43111 / CIP 107115 / JCM 7437 / KCTC 9190 / NBRC 14626 / NCTC 10488 / NRRL B-5397 / IMRU 509) TaxID=446468 RepID=D7B150_NOCDD|nr:parB-like partition protein [Nocardiopsis dassonvillei subsp. dassonvillei DSM 43111]VEI90763.1 Probable chromosome-partitioning protein parB [Nocardiopsis dassonvillei]